MTNSIAIATPRIIDLTDSLPDITANIVHDSEFNQLPSDIFENDVFQALSDLLDDFAINPHKYLQAHHQEQLNNTAHHYLNS